MTPPQTSTGSHFTIWQVAVRPRPEIPGPLQDWAPEEAENIIHDILTDVHNPKNVVRCPPWNLLKARLLQDILECLTECLKVEVILLGDVSRIKINPVG
jgi:hypothetical protein